jgi:hypothetical protein
LLMQLFLPRPVESSTPVPEPLAVRAPQGSRLLAGSFQPNSNLVSPIDHVHGPDQHINLSLIQVFV